MAHWVTSGISFSVRRPPSIWNGAVQTPPPQCEDVPNGAIYRATALRWEPQHTVTRRAEQSRAGKQTGSRVTQEVTQAREAGLGPAVGRIMV